MAKGIGKWDGPLLGAIAGGLLAYPDWTTTIHKTIVGNSSIVGTGADAVVKYAGTGIIPEAWLNSGFWVVPAIFIGVGALIGFIVERSR